MTQSTHKIKKKGKTQAENDIYQCTRFFTTIIIKLLLQIYKLKFESSVRIKYAAFLCNVTS